MAQCFPFLSLPPCACETDHPHCRPLQPPPHCTCETYPPRCLPPTPPPPTPKPPPPTPKPPPQKPPPPPPTPIKCPHHPYKWKRLKKFSVGLLIFNFIALVLILFVWAILQPKKPRFILQDATVYDFNVNPPNLLTSSIGVTIFSRNPNHMIGIYYDKLSVYAAYQSQQITYYSGISPAYQGHKDVNVWSPVLSGVNVPVAPYNTFSLCQDQAAGNLRLIIKVDALVRFKVGTYISRRYHLYVKCRAFINLGAPTNGIIVGNGVKYQLSQSCSVTV